MRIVIRVRVIIIYKAESFSDANANANDTCSHFQIFTQNYKISVDNPELKMPIPVSKKNTPLYYSPELRPAPKRGEPVLRRVAVAL